jgi:hypothetical protein
MTFWRIWHCRNEVVEHKPAPPIESSKGFLSSYLQSILMIKQSPEAVPTKGKTTVVWHDTVGQKKKRKDKTDAPQRPWRKPPEGFTKLNVDGSFCAASASGGTGAVLRDKEGTIIFSTCRHLQPCLNPLEAELEACRDGVALALDWSTLPCMVEMDCPEAVKMIRSGELDRSPFTGLVQEIKHLLASRSDMIIDTIDRDQNRVSHGLANLGRNSSGTLLWPGSGPVNVTALCRDDCNLFD